MVSSPFLEQSSTKVDAAAARMEIAIAQNGWIPPRTKSTTKTAMAEVTSMATEPSTLFLLSASFQVILCFPYFLPINAAKASPTPQEYTPARTMNLSFIRPQPIKMLNAITPTAKTMLEVNSPFFRSFTNAEKPGIFPTKMRVGKSRTPRQSTKMKQCHHFAKPKSRGIYAPSSTKCKIFLNSSSGTFVSFLTSSKISAKGVRYARKIRTPEKNCAIYLFLVSLSSFKYDYNIFMEFFQ